MSKNDKQAIRMLAVGDVMLGDHPVCFGHGVRSRIEKHGISALFENVRNLHLEGDLLVGNLEAMLADSDGSNKLYDLEMKGKSDYAVGLAEAGFSVLSVANNHALQHGVGAFNHTLEVLKSVGVNPIGIREGCGSNTYIYNTNGISVALVGYSMRPEKYHAGLIPYAAVSDDSILEQVGNLRNKVTHVVVSVHWGEEYLHYPSVDQIHLARKIIDAGARVVLGHHPHVLQGYEEYGAGIIAYSLGNYIFDHWQIETRETVVLDCVLGNEGIKRFEFVPVLINKHYQPEILRGKNAEKLLEKIKIYSDGIEELSRMPNDDNERQRYLEKARKAYDKYRKESYIYFIRHIYKYRPAVLVDSLVRFAKRRINPDHP